MSDYEAIPARVRSWLRDAEDRGYERGWNECLKRILEGDRVYLLQRRGEEPISFKAERTADA